MRWFYRLWPEQRGPGRRALVLAGGGVIGGMFEVGVLAALDEELQGCCVNNFDIFVGSSAGAVVASLMANGVRPTDLYRILGEGLPDPMNFSRGSVYDRRAFSGAAGRLGQLVWAVGKNILTGLRSSWPDLLAQAPRAVAPARAGRVACGGGETAGIPISQAIAASSAIPGFFEPYTIGERDFVDGGVGYTGHADLAAERGAGAGGVINPVVPLMASDGGGR